LWDTAVQQANPKLWKRGVSLLKKTDLWKAIEEDENYKAVSYRE